jgi:S-adenosylmethionine hydrolase
MKRVDNSRRKIITLTTDFGLSDNYSGIIKGVIAAINPFAEIVDITHNVPAFNIVAGSYLLETALGAFQPGSIHMAVVDPGVGGPRKPIIIETKSDVFVGPDNGLFSFVRESQIRKIILITNKNFIFSDSSATFHGRDIFAPAAAFLAQGVKPSEFGRPCKSIVRLNQRSSRKTRKRITGSLIYIDRFGNLVSSIRAEKIPDGRTTVFLDKAKIGQIKKTFGSVKPGKPVCYINSFGFLEVAVNKASAAEYFSIDYSSGAQFLIALE